MTMQNTTDHDDVVQGATDSDLERMLDDAYDVPAVPRSLLKRLDHAVEREWGVSPGLSQREASTLARAARRGSRVLRTWPVATSLALMIVAVIVLNSGTRAYGWAKLMDALGRAEVVQFTESDGTTVRWMSVTKGLLGKRYDGRSRLLKFKEGIALQRDAGDTQIQRRSFTRSSETSQEESVVIAFLLDNLIVEGDSIRQTNLVMVDESWSSASNGDVVLRVKLKSNTESVELNIVIDRETHLPKTCDIVGSDSSLRQVALSYPDTNTTELLARDFPSDLPVVDVATLAGGIAGADNQPLPDSAPSALAVVDDNTPGENEPPAVALFGAASLRWKPVKPSSLSSHEAVTQINTTLEAVWKKNGIEPAGPASDEELLRRVYLDLAGRTPNVSEVRSYLADKSPDRYLKLVNQLLASRDFATHLATVWRTYLIPEGVDLSRFGGTQSFEKWIGTQFVDGVPYDKIVRKLLLAEGRLTQSGPLLFYAAAKLDPDQLATRSARVFLGMRLDCAQCHDDRFEPWLQEDFWGYAAFFARISRPQGVLQNVSTVLRVRDVERGEVMLPETDIVVAPSFLDGSPIDNGPKSIARRRQLADWLTASDNPFFARATANRVWGLLFGKGIVDPVDGFGTQHKPVSQELLDQLAGQFIASDHDLRELFRVIVLSRAYRLSSGAETPDPKRHDFFAQMNVKLLTAEQMYDCITVASMLVSAEMGTGFNLARVGNSRRDLFLQQFRAPPGRATEYQSGIPQALTLMNGGLIEDATSLQSSGLLESLTVPFITNKDRMEILYLATLSRRPTSSEQELLNGFMSEDTAGDELTESLADILWALLNSAEFTMNH